MELLKLQVYHKLALENKCLYPRWKNEGRQGLVPNFHTCSGTSTTHIKKSIFRG